MLERDSVDAIDEMLDWTREDRDFPYQPGQVVASDNLLEKAKKRLLPKIITSFDINTGKTTYITNGKKEKTVKKTT